ncbi:hypothetical protein N866_04345 [Actinotalea ferrariae CF5-4]|uniref:Uncharacterized protein n=1 Tax=Actinotalea ferrariae CF5-4 TaxID=948458 RepID=A0A021VUI2_9CELL|nr:hypothetical protein [Actinotalea ferrariae]EYR64811.1 hypothetical protein N866_04345 [Actinotalea ferrariae CF5-4]
MTDSTGLPRPAGGPGAEVDRRTGDLDVHDGAPPPPPGPVAAGSAPAGASPATEPAASAPAAPDPVPGRDERRRHRRRVATTAALVVLALALAASTVHLYRTSTAWEARAGAYLQDARGLGEDLASTRAALAGTESELEAVRAQLATAQGRIVELADEKAQIGDDREVQRQLVDYQERVSDAAGQVALALDQCVQGQGELIGYLENTVTGVAQYDPLELERFRTDVDELCQTATEANIALQRELSR